MKNRALAAPSVEHIAELTCHPGTPSRGAVRRVDARARRTSGGALALAYVLEGDLTRLLIPPLGRPPGADRLWEHTCFEAFVSARGNPEYYEFNFACSGEWAAYAFRSYRNPFPTRRGAMSGDLQDASLAEKAPVSRINARTWANGIELEAIVRLDRLRAIPPRAPLRLALCAVIEQERGRLTYWALQHPPGKPDFHHADGFLLELGPPKDSAESE